MHHVASAVFVAQLAGSVTGGMGEAETCGLRPEFLPVIPDYSDRFDCAGLKADFGYVQRLALG